MQSQTFSAGFARGELSPCMLFNRPQARPLVPGRRSLDLPSGSQAGRPTSRQSFEGSRDRETSGACTVFRHFTDHSIRAILSAQREAEALQDARVLPVHILLGLIAWDSWRLREFLGPNANVASARRIAQELIADEKENAQEEESEESQQSLPSLLIPFSSEASDIFKGIAEEADLLQERIILPEHILLGVISSHDLKVQVVLDRLGIDRKAARRAALSRLGLPPPTAQPSADMDLPQDSQQGQTTGTPTEGPTILRTASVESETLNPALLDPQTIEELQEDLSAVDRFCYDLTQQAREGRFSQVIGRQSELTRVIQILARKSKNNPVLIGEPGTGKTAIAEGLAAAIALGKDGSGQKMPSFLLGKRVLALDVGLLMAGSKWVGVLEQRVTKLIKEVNDAGNIILVIDEIHTMVGAGGTGDDGNGGLSISNLMKPALARGRMQVIGATTLKEHKQHFEKDPALERRFQPVLVEEPSQEAALQILQGLQASYEEYHGCKYAPEAVEAAVTLSTRYIPDRFLPDKAMDLLDEAGSKARMAQASARREQGLLTYLDYAVKLQQVMAKKAECVWANEDAEARTWKKKELELRQKQKENQAVIDALPPPMIGKDDIAQIVSAWTGIPVTEAVQSERETLLNLSKTLKERVIGQDTAVETISSAVMRARSGLRDASRPVVSLMFCGSTGVGKTELAKALAASYFGSETAMVRLDMSEYMEQHSVAKLIGAPPGYVGHGETGTLTEAVKRQPHCLLLLDEIEKAHPDVFNLLLQVLNDGRLTESDGRKVSFREAMIIMTSNAGADCIQGGSRQVGFEFSSEESSKSSSNVVKSRVMEELKGTFQPEFLNRLDDIVVFNSLDGSSAQQLAALLINQTSSRLEEAQGCSLQLSGSLLQRLVKLGISKEYGARPLRRVITTLIEDPMADAILNGEVRRGDIAVLDWDEDKQRVTVTVSSTRQSPLVASNIVGFRRSPSAQHLQKSL